ncbi:putative peptidoglycan binding domain protein [Planomonospora sphaerica]|uniref:Putative peptidoglycan binding domain protein n=1 Tax=Planomonospora sphaerica TaxID=161355 RepID=A0A161LND1_9ACTN|nr:glycoside hydrolase domain-containing protein [Planomonospora sphaerica]GAT69155.1 putative peptidoglycan binding domain protein [Planomonospora sphaerica]
MDAKVLEAQKWVNATYGQIAGYKRCPEDGATGWSTMFSLTRALQIELGITALSDSFGPTTLSKLTALGDIGPSTANKNIVRILQHGLFCKGYWGGNQYGVYDGQTALSVGALAKNAGLLHTSTVQPKLFKAILTMDAYTLVAGGKESVRAVQQWLNGRYTPRANFFVIPCDGIFSRDVQKALYLAIQFELGMTDSQATGVFGPGTQAGLKNHSLSSGDSGIWVQLFSAAAVFNGAVGYRTTQGGWSYREPVFTDGFGTELRGWVRVFQEFTCLPDDGDVDFATWCQVLVSTGDPNRPGTAADCIATVTEARAKALYAAGYRVIGRYLDERPSGNPLNKQIQPGELQVIFQNKLKVFPISQYYGGEVGYFTYQQGYTDAVGAHTAAVRYGFDSGTVIYFAVDYDATQAEIESNIVPYFRGVVSGLVSKGKRYVHGVYGSRNVCAQVTKATLARWSFVSGMSTGFSGNMGYPLPENWSFNQIQTLTVGSGDGRIEIDKNIHAPGKDPGVSAVNTPSTEIDEFVAYIRRLYDLATTYTGSSRNPDQLVMEFLRHVKYNDTQWKVLIGDCDEGFIEHVNAAGVKMINEVRDPFYGVDINVDHFGANCNGVYIARPPSGVGVSSSDVTGWGGDLMTFYGEWRRDSASYSSGYTYCIERLAKVDGDGTFKLRDLIEDADSYNITMRVLSGNTNIADAVEAYYKTDSYRSRFKQFYDGRFGGTESTLWNVTDLLLAGGVDPVIALGRAFLIEKTGGVPTVMPHLLPEAKWTEFLQGFKEVLLSRVNEEGARIRSMRNGDGT